eukprot:scaffold6211_cov118-Isochrysis_galbana.AAC.8
MRRWAGLRSAGHARPPAKSAAARSLGRRRRGPPTVGCAPSPPPVSSVRLVVFMSFAPVAHVTRLRVLPVQQAQDARVAVPLGQELARAPPQPQDGLGVSPGRGAQRLQAAEQQRDHLLQPRLGRQMQGCHLVPVFDQQLPAGHARRQQPRHAHILVGAGHVQRRLPLFVQLGQRCPRLQQQLHHLLAPLGRGRARAACGCSASTRRASATSLVSTASTSAAASSNGPATGATGSSAPTDGRSQCTAERRERRGPTAAGEVSLAESSPDPPDPVPRSLPVSCRRGMKASCSSPRPSSRSAAGLAVTVCIGAAIEPFILVVRLLRRHSQTAAGQRAGVSLRERPVVAIG